MLNDASGELDFVEEMLIEDSKNYHAWSYRQWYVATNREPSQAHIHGRAEPELTDLKSRPSN
jgi:hypothetical protein